MVEQFQDRTGGGNMIKPSEVRQIKRRITQAIAKELGGTVTKGAFARHAKSPDYSLYGRNNFIRDAPKATKPAKPKKK